MMTSQSQPLDGGPLASVTLRAPRLMGTGAPVVLQPVSGRQWQGAPGSPAEGLSVAVDMAHAANASHLSVQVCSRTEHDNVQLVLPFELSLSWKSYIIAPGALYNGNRFIVSPQPYAPYLLTEGITPQGPIVMADVPRLSADTGYRVELAANALAIPAIGVYDPTRQVGFLIGLPVYGEWGISGVNMQTLPGEPVRIELCLPVKRRRRYQFCDWVDADERGMRLTPDHPIHLHVTVIPVTTDAIPGLITRLAEYGHTVRGQEKRRPICSFAEAAACVEQKLDAHNWNEAQGYYQSQMGNTGWILQTGWVGGGPTFHAMALSDNPERRRRALRMMDGICTGALSPSGYFHGLHDGERWRSFGVKRPGCRAFSLIRRPLECTRDVLKTLALLKSRGERIAPSWEEAARRNLDAMVNTAARAGHLGYTVDFDTGEVLWGDSCCGAFGIEPLVRGAAWFHEPAYLGTAVRLAEYYAAHFLARGFTCGGVGDALMAVDSESNYALLAGLTHLYLATQDPRHLAWARQAADLFSTWVLHYDARIPAATPLGRLGIQPRGAVFANIQNSHGAPGICTASGQELALLARITGEERYLHLLEDIAHCMPQMMVRPGQEEIWADLPPGSMSERLMTMDGMAPLGHTAILSTWSEIALLLTARELSCLG